MGGGARWEGASRRGKMRTKGETSGRNLDGTGRSHVGRAGRSEASQSNLNHEPLKRCGAL